MKKQILLLTICACLLFSMVACNVNETLNTEQSDSTLITESVSPTLSPTPSPTIDVPSIIEAMLPTAPIDPSVDHPSSSMITANEKEALVEFLALIYVGDLENAYAMIYNDESSKSSFLENSIDLDNATIVSYYRDERLGWTVAFGYMDQRRHRSESWLIWVKEDQNGGYIDSYMYMYFEM
jgi:hypothetical protein